MSIMPIYSKTIAGKLLETNPDGTAQIFTLSGLTAQKSALQAQLASYQQIVSDTQAQITTINARITQANTLGVI